MLPLLAEIWTDAPITDERSAARRTLRLEVAAHSPRDATKTLIHNLSETGLLIETAADLQVGETLQVDLPHAGIATALVIWHRDQFAGCEFVTPLSKAAVSAALLRSPGKAVVPSLATPAPSRQEWADSADREGQQSRAGPLLLISLLLSLGLATIFVIALLTFPFALE